MPITTLFRDVIDKLYYFHYSNFGGYVVGEIENVNILIPFYAFIIFSLILIYCIFKFFINPVKRNLNASFAQLATIVWILSFFSFLGIQQFRSFDNIKSELKTYIDETHKDPIGKLYGSTYYFAKDVKRILPYNMGGVEFLTDVDIGKDPYMSDQRALAYFLYPKLTVRFDHREKSKDFILLFYKNNPQAAVPDGYTTIIASEDYFFALAVKDEIAHVLNKP